MIRRKFKSKPKASHFAQVLGQSVAQAEAWSDSLLVGGKAGVQAPAVTSRWPLGLILGVVTVIGGILVWQLFNLTIISGQRFAGLANGNRLRIQITYAPRGRILDRNGVVLAANTASFQLVAYPYLLARELGTRQSAYQMISAKIHKPVGAIRQLVESKGLASVDPILVKDHINYQIALVLEQKLPSLAGWSLDGVPERVYKADAGVGNILGYVGRAATSDLKANRGLSPIDFVGKDGIEATYDKILRGTNGEVETEVDSLGRPIRTLTEQPVVPGRDIKLSIDYHLQQVYDAAIQREMAIAHSKHAAGVALDPHTGAVLAMVTNPGYNNNLFARGISVQSYQRLINDPNTPLINRTIAGQYPSGSIIKPFELSGALQEGVVTPSTVIVDRGKIVLPNPYHANIQYVFNGWVPGGLGPMDAVKAIAWSSDIYFYTVGGGFEGFSGMGVDRLDKWYKLWGLGQPTGIDLPGEQAGVVPTPARKKQTTGQDWTIGDTYHLAIGQGDLLVNPLQMAVATAAIANGGSLLKPHLFESTVDGRDSFKTQVTRSGFVAPSHLSVVRQGMRQAVTNGATPAYVFGIVPVPVAGKSGTAEVGYQNKEVPHAWFEAYAPYDNPQIVFALVVEHGIFGSGYAAPAIASTMQWYFSQHR